MTCELVLKVSKMSSNNACKFVLSTGVSVMYVIFLSSQHMEEQIGRCSSVVVIFIYSGCANDDPPLHTQNIIG